MKETRHKDQKSVLVIEDDPNTLALVALYLEREGFRALTAEDGEAGIALARSHRPDLVVLDLMLPKMDGWEVCRQLRRQGDIPVIMLTARGEEIDRVAGLTLGADDYVVKPFSPRELVARVQAVLRRTGRPAGGSGSVVRHGELELDLEKRRLSVSGQPTDLTPREYALLEALIRSPGRTYTRDELLMRLYPDGDTVVVDRVVDVHIGKLRHKIEPDPSKPRYIITAHGLGYRFADKLIPNGGKITMNSRLIYKLLAITVTLIVFVVAVVWIAIDTLAAGYFVTLMEKYHVSPEPAHDMFVSAIHRYILWAFLAAVGLAVALSFIMMGRVLAPLARMTRLSRDIAAGNFSVRVPDAGKDEVGHLSRAFNHMAQSLEKLEQLRRNLMIDVAHELRTPLTNIRGYLEALNDNVLPPSPQTLSLLQQETFRLAALVEDVLELARADAARGMIKPEPLSVRNAIETALEPFKPVLAQKKIAIAIPEKIGDAQLTADHAAMARTLRNLFDNAARYTPSGATVVISVEQTARGIRIDIANPAGGLTPEDMPFLFERFYRGEKSRSRRHGGAGIGLAIVKELVEAHGGSVEARFVPRASAPEPHSARH